MELEGDGTDNGQCHFPPELAVRKLSADLGVVKQRKPKLSFRVPGNQ